jgi:hypothetical protein
MGSANQREANLRDVTSTERAIQIEHVTMRSSKPFVTVKGRPSLGRFTLQLSNALLDYRDSQFQDR